MDGNAENDLVGHYCLDFITTVHNVRAENIIIGSVSSIQEFVGVFPYFLLELPRFFIVHPILHMFM